MMEYIPTLIWTAVAGFGAWMTSRAIGTNAAMVEAAENQKMSPTVIQHLRNVLFTYRTRFWLITNNFLIGLLALVSAGSGLNDSWLGVYVTLSLLVNEATLIYLTYRDQKILTRK